MPKKKKTKRAARRKSVPRLTARLKRFAQEYALDFNATKAAGRAGYSASWANSHASEALKRPEVIAIVESITAAASEKSQVTKERLLEEVGVISFSSVDDYEWDSKGNLKVKDGVPPEAIRAIASVKVEVAQYGEHAVLIKKQFKLWDKPRALNLGMRHLGMLNDKLEIDVHGEFEKMIGKAAEEYDREIARLASRRKAESKAP